MPQFSAHSREQLAGVHPLLREVLETAIVDADFRVDQGGRTAEEQNRLADEGRTTLRPPAGNHLIQPDGYAHAVDVWPYVNGQRLEVPTWAEFARRFEHGDAKQWVQDAVGKYAQFAWLMRGIQAVSLPILEAHAQTTGERWVLRFGLDWDGDGEILTDQSFDDYPHVEIRRVG